MPASASAPKGRLADLSLATYLAPLFAQRRVAVVGTTSGEVARRARALGAATVVSFGGTGEDIAVRALTPGAIAAFHGKLDVILVPDARAVPSLPAVLDEARRALGSEGILAVAGEPDDGPITLEPTPRTGGISFDDLHDQCAARFAIVRMLGRGPFVGYCLASLDEGAAEVALDTRLMDGDPPRPEAFVAVASDTALALDPLLVVQVPDALLDDVRRAAAEGVESQLTQRDAKLREVEQASAERWVKIQRYEHALKEQEEELRKTRDRAVRLQKELDDERKLRQRIELEGQMARRAPELPKTPDLEPEVRRLKDQLAKTEAALTASAQSALGAEAEVASLRAGLSQSQHTVTRLQGELEARGEEHAAARTQVVELQRALDAARAQVSDLQRELDETQATEADLRAQLDEHDSAPRVDPRLRASLDEATQRIAALTRAADEATQRAAQSSAAADAATQRLAAAGAAADEHRARAEQAEGEARRLETVLSQRVQELARMQRERTALEQSVRELGYSLAQGYREAPVASVSSDELAQRDAALAAAREALDAAQSRLRVVEAQALAHAGELQQAQWRVAELEAELGAAQPVTVVETPDEVRAMLSQFEAREASLAASNRETTARAEAAEQRVSELERSLGDEHARHEQQRMAAHEARNEVSRLYALNVGYEARVVHLGMEIDGLRTGYQRRLAELEAETDRLLRALEVVGTQAAVEATASVQRHVAQIESLHARAEGMSYRLREAEDALRSKGAARRDAEVAVAALVAERDGLRQRAQELAARLDEAQREAEEPARLDAFDDAMTMPSQGQFRADQLMGDLTATAGRLAETEESLAAAQGELRALRETVRALEGHAAERDLALQALLSQLEDRDRVLATLERRLLERVEPLQRVAAEEARDADQLRHVLGTVRHEIGAILADGRGALVAHDLMSILRTIERGG